MPPDSLVRMRRGLSTLVLALLLALTGASAAVASPNQIYDDCQDGKLDRKYSQKDLKAALEGMPGDLDEYTNCREVVRQARFGLDRPDGADNTDGGAGAGGAGGTGGDSGLGGAPIGQDGKQADPVALASEADKQAAFRARSGADVQPTATGIAPGKASGAGLPVPLIIVLVLTGAAGLALAAPKLMTLASGLRPAR